MYPLRLGSEHLVQDRVSVLASDVEIDCLPLPHLNQRKDTQVSAPFPTET